MRSVVAETGISKSSVACYFQFFGLRRRCVKRFKLSSNMFFVEKRQGVVGLYQSPPDNTLDLSVDERIQCRTRERIQLMLPIGFDYIESVARDYKCHATATLYAGVLKVLNEAVVVSYNLRHRHSDYLSFLQYIKHAVSEAQYPLF